MKKQPFKRPVASTLDDSNSVEITMVVRMRAPKYMAHSSTLARALEGIVQSATKQKDISVTNYGSADQIREQFPDSMGEAGALARVVLTGGQ